MLIRRWERCGRFHLLFEVPSTAPPIERVARNLLSDVFFTEMPTSCGSHPCPTRPDAPAAGIDGDEPDTDDEEMNNRVLRELELVRQEQQPQQEQAPQNDPPPDNGTSPIASSGGRPRPRTAVRIHWS